MKNIEFILYVMFFMINFVKNLKHKGVELRMVLKWQIRLILHKIQYNFYAGGEVRLTPFEDDKWKVCKILKFKAYGVRLPCA